MKIRAFLWLSIDALYSLISGITYVLISFFIWEQSNSINLILWFNVIIFLTLLCNSFISGLFSVVGSPKLSYLLSITSFTITAYFVYTLQEETHHYIVFISILIGLVYSFLYTARPLINRTLVDKTHFISYNSIKQILFSVISVSTPLIINLGLQFKSYTELLYISMFGFFTLLLLSLLFIPKTNPSQRIIIHKLLAKSFTNSTIKKISHIKLSNGIAYSMGWGLLNILVLEQLGSVSNWSYISIAGAIVGILISYKLKSLDINNTSLSRMIISTSAMCFAVLPILLVVNFTLELFIIFMLAKVAFEKVTNIISENYIYSIESKDHHFEEKQISYQIFSDIFMSLGQLVPVAILFILPESLLSTTTLIIMLTLTSLAPYLTSKSYSTYFQTIQGIDE